MKNYPIRICDTLMKDSKSLRINYRIFQKNGEVINTMQPFYRVAKSMMNEDSMFISMLNHEFINGEWIVKTCVKCGSHLYNNSTTISTTILGQERLVHKYCV